VGHKKLIDSVNKSVEEFIIATYLRSKNERQGFQLLSYVKYAAKSRLIVVAAQIPIGHTGHNNRAHVVNVSGAVPRMMQNDRAVWVNSKKRRNQGRNQFLS